MGMAKFHEKIRKRKRKRKRKKQRKTEKRKTKEENQKSLFHRWLHLSSVKNPAVG
jgi:hypothetical protein